MKKTKIQIVLCILILGMAWGVGAFASPNTMIPLYIGQKKFTVEVADTPEKRALGLMFRESIPDNFGMLFLFDAEEDLSFWMKNCKVHLDIIYLDSSKRVVDMYSNVPPCKNDPCPSYESRKPARYVLELRGNRAKELNLKAGDLIFFLPGR
ncbi:MAG: DUF192 domain-containing protein [Candidatus Omnitrophota bacterium]